MYNQFLPSKYTGTYIRWVFHTTDVLLYLQCIKKEKLLQLHHINKEKAITKEDFIQLCPSLVYEVQSGACLHIEKSEEHHDHKADMTLEG